MKTKTLPFALLIVALVIAGCSTPEQRIKHNPELFASIPATDQELIKKGRIAIGFTPDMVKLALGEPDYIARRIDRNGSSEVWRYLSYDPGVDYGIYGGYGWGGYGWGGYGWGGYRNPYWGGWGRYGGYYGGWGWGGWAAAPAPQSDYLRVTMQEGRVTQIEQLR